MAIALSELTPDIRAEIPEIPGFVAERYLIRAARDFADFTRAWREDFNVDVVADIPIITFNTLVTSAVELLDVISVKDTLGNTPVTPTTYAKLDRERADWREETDVSALYYVRDGYNSIRLVPTPAESISNKYYIRLALKPLLTATSFDDTFGRKYDEALIHGALGRLFAQPRKPWTDETRAAFHNAAFEAAKLEARSEAADEFQTGVPRKVKYGGL